MEGCIPRVFALCEMQAVLYKIWTQITVSISYNNKHSITGASYIYVCVRVCILDVD